MISRSIYIACQRDELVRCLSNLGVEEADIAFGDIDIATAYLAARRNGASVAATKGAFAFLCDVDLFDRDEPTLLAQLAKLSLSGCPAAMPVERDPDPEVFWLWENGQRRLVRIWEDDDARLLIHDPLRDAGLPSPGADGV